MLDQTEFIKEVKKYYPNQQVVTMLLKDIYNGGKSTQTTRVIGIYALFYNNELKK